MKTLTIRGVDDQLSDKLKNISRKEHKSLNNTILCLLKERVGLSGKETFPTHHDLDAFAGKWTEEDAAEFIKNTHNFNQIEKELWD